MRKFPSPRLFAISLATAAAFAMTACSDDDDDTDTNDSSGSSETDEDHSDNNVEEDPDDDTSDDAGPLTDEEFAQCSYLGVDFVHEIGTDLSTQSESTIQELADSTESYMELVEHPEIHASASNLFTMLDEAASDPSAYSGGSQEMVDLMDELVVFTELCATHGPDGS